ncbi:MAG TPA: hypothetical protein VHG28_07725 [Longimicrobiaceae bacterium]|nr:hypothetical protein [Longimicrobiaceae bacterium]
MLTLLDRYPGAYRLLRALRLSRGGRALARVRERRITPARLARHAAAAQLPDPSHASEWTHLRGLLDRLGLAGDGFAVDLAAGDGVTSSCTLPLFRDRGWSGLAVECDPVRFALLEHVYRGFGRVRLARRRVTPGNAAALLAEHGVPREFTVLNLDLDSYDLAVAGAVLAAFRPLVVDMEVNEKIPPPVRFALRYTPDFRWDEGHCYGCSLSAAADVLGAAGYRLEGLEYNNAFFVRADLAKRQGLRGVTPEAAYRAGYAERADRRRLFPWNRDMEDLLECGPEEVVSRLARRFGPTRASWVLQRKPLGPGWADAPGGSP